MRNIGIAAWLLLVSQTFPAAAEPFPYTAYVTADDVYVRSGPGRSYYPTDKLAKGAEVEIYRHDPGGWYAIRPPQGSFSWVSSRYIERTQEGLGVVVDDDVVARVGSQLSNVRDVIQVRLEPQETVEIVGEHEAGGQLWYKIAAPAGEFRWISSDYLDREPPPDGVSKPRREPKKHFARQQAGPAGQPTVALATAEEPIDEAEPVLLAADEQEPGLLPDAMEQESRPIANRLVRQIEQQAVDEGEIETVSYNAPADREVVRIAREDTSPRWQAPHQPAASAPPTGAARGAARSNPPRVQPSQRSFESELKAIDLEISEMVAEEPTVWAFGELQQRTEALLDRASTAIERGEARRLQHQIARLEDIKARYRQVGAVLDETDRRNSQLETRGATPRFSPAAHPAAPPAHPAATANRTVPPVSVDTQFDGQGILRPVVSRRQDAPRYALVDAQGEVLSFLTPSPGVNLQSYLGTPIGVLGTRGYMPDLRKPHVMVQRVESLDVTVLR